MTVNMGTQTYEMSHKQAKAILGTAVALKWKPQVNMALKHIQFRQGM